MKRFGFLMVVLVLALFSCKKDTNNDENNNTSTDDVLAASQNSLASNMFDDVYKQVDNSNAIVQDSCGGKKSLEGPMSYCVTITLGTGEFDTITWPKHITVDFGMAGCQGFDYRIRKGKLLYTTTGWFHDSGTVVTVTTDNYYVDGYKVEGTKTITNNGRNSNQNLNWHVVVTNALITHPNGDHHTWNTDRTTEWIFGESTPLDFWDNKFSTKGTANGTTTTGATYTFTIDNAHPLITQFGCRWIEQGILTLTVTSHPSITIDYGNGTCDADAIATVNGVNYPFVMQ